MKTYGILNYKSEIRSFVFEDYILTILPNTIPLEENQFKELVENLKSIKHSVVGVVTLKGKTSDCRSVIFEVYDFYSNDNGLIFYEVINCSLFNELENDHYVSGVSLGGDLIDTFFPPEAVFSSKKLINNNGINEFHLTTNNKSLKLSDIHIKRYGLDVSITFDTLTKNNHNSSIPFRSESYMILKFSKRLTTNEAIELISDLLSFFKFINYSLVVSLEKILIIDFIENKHHQVGEILIKDITKEFKIIRAHYDIKLNDFKDLSDLEKMLSIYLNEQLNNDFIAHDMHSKKTITKMRVIQISAAFENYLEDVIGSDVISPKYLDAKELLVNYIDEQTKGLSKEKSKQLKSIKRIIELHIPLFEKLNYLKNNDKTFVEIVTEVFGSEFYGDKILVERISKIRNSIAHGDISVNITSQDVTRIRYLIICVYYLVLCKADVSNNFKKSFVKKIYTNT